jgi:hypothetical protein
MATAIFALVMFGKESCFCPGQSGQQSYFTLPFVAGMTGVPHCTQLLDEMGFHKVGWP